MVDSIDDGAAGGGVSEINKSIGPIQVAKIFRVKKKRRREDGRFDRSSERARTRLSPAALHAASNASLELHIFTRPSPAIPFSAARTSTVADLSGGSTSGDDISRGERIGQRASLLLGKRGKTNKIARVARRVARRGARDASSSSRARLRDVWRGRSEISTRGAHRPETRETRAGARGVITREG